jgi:dipeptidyl-peptidase 4
MTDTFPRQQARTRRFTLGAPRSFRVSPDGTRIVFLRSKSGTDPVTCLWVLDLVAGTPWQPHEERLVVDPASIVGSAEEPAEEQARRERSRESARGVVAFATDAEFTMAAFAVAGQLYTTSLEPGGHGPELAGAMSPAIDPRPDPAGQLVAYVCHGAVRITDVHTGVDTELIGPGTARESGGDRSDGESVGPGDITFGLAEYVAAEEMGRHRGYWWSPDGTAMLVARVDNTPVGQWHIADPANPDQRPVRVRYPAAGTPNALVSLLIVNLDGSVVPVRWDADAFSYLATADWDDVGPLIVVQSRDQRRMRLLDVDPRSGETTVLREDSDPDWLDIVPGVPARTSGGQIAWTANSEGSRRLLVATADELRGGTAAPLTPAGMQVREVLSVDGDTVLFTAWDGEPTQIGVWAYGIDGSEDLARIWGHGPGAARAASAPASGPAESPVAGVETAVSAGGTTVLTSRSMAGPGATTRVLRYPPASDEPAAGRAAPATAVIVTTIGSLAERPVLTELRVMLMRSGERELRTALVLPSWYEPGSAKLPVLMDPYGGPHSQRVLASADAYLTSQWFADQGFAVIVADGRGTPGRGPEWDRTVAGDFSALALEDQVDALAAVARRCASEHLADLDLSRVGIRGWSFGGYLSALAVLRRPDVFHAGVAGAPVTDWRLYDTHYTERYLGDPGVNAAAYDRSSLMKDAAKLSRPLMIIHGLADDNVVIAHSLRLSAALLAAGRPHTVLPLTGVTHMASQEAVAENLLLLQADFLREALGVPPRGAIDDAPV